MRRLTAHWELKLLSLAVAILLWGFVVGGERGEMALTVPLEFQGIPSGLELASDYPESVTVQVGGLRAQLVRLRGESLRAQVPLAGARAGEISVRLLPDYVRVPPGVHVIRLTPSRLRVMLDHVESATVKVVPRLMGTLPTGFVLKAVRVSPAEVEVRGARSEVRHLRQIETEPIDLSSLRGPITRSTPLAGPGGSVRVVGPAAAEVALEVIERRS